MPHILIVEDDIVSQKLLQAYLSTQGYQVCIVSDILSGRERLDSQTYDLVLLDLNLPDGNGMELVAHLRNVLKKLTPVIILSGSKQESSVFRVMKSGADDYMTKPFSIKEVLLRVQHSLS